MQYVALGATDDIGASCHFLDIDGTGIVFDAGSDPEKEGIEGVPRFDFIHDSPDWYVDHALITHAHHDHVGNLPVLMQHFPHVQVHMTPATQKLADFLLPASARLQRRKVEHEGATFDPLYSEEEIEMYSHLYLTHDLEVPFNVTGLRGRTNISAQFFDAGHILGSAGVLLTVGKGEDVTRLFYTSDTNVAPQTIIPGADYPERSVDVLLLETTSGADEEQVQTTRAKEESKFRETLSAVLEAGGTVLIPSFAMGRAQEMLALIDQFKDEGAIEEDVPVYTAGSMRAIADLYDRTAQITPRQDPSFKVFGVEQKRLPRSREATDEALQGPSIHVVSSGMMFEPTLSNKLARRLIEDEKNAILIVGYAIEGSPAARLLESAAKGQGAEVELSPEQGPQPVNCLVERFRFTGHSDRRQLVNLAERLNPEAIVLVHGETAAKDWMESALRDRLDGVRIHRPRLGQAISLGKIQSHSV